MQTATKRGINSSIDRYVRLTLLLPISAALIVARPTKAQAQEPLTLTGVVTTIGSVYGGLKTAYDAYQTIKSWGEPNPTTADLINQAVTEIQNTVIGIDVTNIMGQFSTAMSDYVYARACTGSDCASKWQNFDSEAYTLLGVMESSINQDVKLANALGMAYNLLLPLYLQAHVSGDQWGIQPLPGSASLLDDYKTVGQRAFGINYNMVGASSVSLPSGGNSPFSPANDSRKKSKLFTYVKASSVGGSSQGDHCWGSDDICLTFLQTNPTAQAVQKAEVALYSVLNSFVTNLNWVRDTATSTTVVVDVQASWANNWQGYANAAWTSMQNAAYGSLIPDNVCQDGFGVVGVWQIPPAWQAAFLCAPIPGYPAWIPGGSTAVWPPPTYQYCGSSLCSYDLQCPGADFLIGGINGAQISCYHRQDGQTNLPPKGTCSSVDHTYTGMPSTGSTFALPAGSYMTGYNMTLYGQNTKKATYYYCGAQVSSGSLGAAMNLGTVNGVSYPLNFNVFTFGNVSGLRDVQGPVASGGTVDASSFSINWGQTQSVGIVSAGQLTLTNGTVIGSIYHGAGESMVGVNFNGATNISGNPIDFAAARMQLRGMSTTIGALRANGTTTISYGNIILTGSDPHLNVFAVDPVDLKNTHSVTITVPVTSTVIINVGGLTAQMASMGISHNVDDLHILWNFFQATSFRSSWVGIPGSVLAPFADAALSGNIDGTLIAETCVSANEFHQVPFVHNWLVP